MPEREVKVTLATYIDADGQTRYGLAGETVTVHPRHVKKFDAANGTPQSRPKKQARPRKT